MLSGRSTQHAPRGERSSPAEPQKAGTRSANFGSRILLGSAHGDSCLFGAFGPRRREALDPSIETVFTWEGIVDPDAAGT